MSQLLDDDPADQVEDATELRFPKEFDTARALLNSEVFMLLENRKSQNEAADAEAELPAVFLKTHIYCQRFSAFKNADTIQSVRSTLSSKGLHDYELTSLANLQPETTEEAKALIPSMERFSGEELQVQCAAVTWNRTFTPRTKNLL
ncbi:hypothetical protein RvY_11730-2 [Ramazzottius varieornatus]|uniref:RNA polymerase Rpb4/RPC9 core domain-containing protein n=1 Tax=Ramazzottius varieornatus TaxID=947166 RepID=A0A1D1VH52_RAMVA|nr:hypothetical protein RvY_11730-2 [Ramazzottius varieornatus]